MCYVSLGLDLVIENMKMQWMCFLAFRQDLVIEERKKQENHLSGLAFRLDLVIEKNMKSTCLAWHLLDSLWGTLLNGFY